MHLFFSPEIFHVSGGEGNAELDTCQWRPLIEKISAQFGTISLA